ncbi:iron-sulfur cluster assembly scaffold protein [bacterium]|nr:iron-sulfur cluster assembly scaffold protein [bacterium]
MIPRAHMEHFRNPRNKRPMSDASATGEVEGRRPGETLKLFLKIGEDGRVVDASFTNTGDRQSDASASALTVLVRGLTVPQLEKLDVVDIAQRLDSPDNPGVATPAYEILRSALAQLKGAPSPYQDEGRLICHCFHVRDGRIRSYVRERDLRTVEQVNRWTRACGGCRSCRPDIELILEQERDRVATTEPGA